MLVGFQNNVPDRRNSNRYSSKLLARSNSKDPNLSAEVLRKLYSTMVTTRIMDDRALALQRQGRIGTFPLIKGQEAAQLGAIAALEDSDWMVPSFRETVAEIWLNDDYVFGGVPSIVTTFIGDSPVPTYNDPSSPNAIAHT